MKKSEKNTEAVIKLISSKISAKIFVLLIAAALMPQAFFPVPVSANTVSPPSTGSTAGTVNSSGTANSLQTGAASQGVSSLPSNSSESEKAEPEFVPFEFVTSEKDDFQPANVYSITFDKKLTLVAETIVGADVSVVVGYGEKSEMPPSEYETVTIGATKKFILPVSLRLGDNFIKITVEKEGLKPTIFEALVKRKDRVIKDSLQNLIVIPGRVQTLPQPTLPQPLPQTAPGTSQQQAAGAQ